jgi:hypothetical protein
MPAMGDGSGRRMPLPGGVVAEAGLGRGNGLWSLVRMDRRAGGEGI